jgi:hypothetical protein
MLDSYIIYLKSQLMYIRIVAGTQFTILYCSRHHHLDSHIKFACVVFLQKSPSFVSWK